MENNLSFSEYKKILEDIKNTEQGDEKIILSALISAVTKKDYNSVIRDLLFISPSMPFSLAAEEKENLYIMIGAFCNKNIPYQYLTGIADFYGREFFVDENVLIPRCDTEVLVEKTLSFMKDDCKILDLCCGSGCIGITLANEKTADVILADFSPKALAVTERNIKKFGLEKKCKTLLHDVTRDELYGEFDIIVSNPPYITAEDMKTLSLYVKKEPDSALFGGKDGLDFYRLISEKYYDKINYGGYIVFECGIYQAEDVSHILELNGFKNIGTAADTAGIERIVWGCRV